MTVLDCILDGLEAELVLERELGVRCIACDRAVLANECSAKPKERALRSQSSVSPPSPVVQVFDFVFLHDRALSSGGVAMMAKIVLAMGKTPDTAPIVITGELPKARAYVVLGHNALKKWFPGTPGSPGQWLQTSVAKNVLVSYSPEYILRFGEVTSAVLKLKREMWTSLKGILQRIR